MLNKNVNFKSDTSCIEAMLEAFFCVQPDKHVQDFRFHWHCRGVDVHTNGWRYDLRGNRIDPSKTLEQAAREYGR